MRQMFIITLCMFLCGNIALSQEINVSEIEDTYMYVKESTVPVSQKFLNAKVWIATTFGNYNSVMQFEDSENFKIIIKGISKLPEEKTEDPIFQLPLRIKPSLYYTMTFDFKEERYRVKFEAINCHSIWITDVLGETVRTEQNQNIKQFCSPVNRPQIELESKTRELNNMNGADVESMSRRERQKHDSEVQKLESEIAKLEVRASAVDNLYKKREESIEKILISIIDGLHDAINSIDNF